MYDSDSSEETVFTKLVEVLVCEWATRMGFEANFLKEKASFEDVNIIIDGKVVVCDAKSFRLGRSQAAPNVKDFLKLEDVRKWLRRYDDPLGGLVTYPDTHEWAKGSDAYLYCSTKDCPTVMLPYVLLAVLLHFKDKFQTAKLSELWDYDRLFPKQLPKKSKDGNRKLYWDVIEREIIRIIGISDEEFCDYLKMCKAKQRECINKNYEYIRRRKEQLIEDIRAEAAKMSEKEVREAYIGYKIKIETKRMDDCMERIKKFRLKENDYID